MTSGKSLNPLGPQFLYQCDEGQQWHLLDVVLRIKQLFRMVASIGAQVVLVIVIL